MITPEEVEIGMLIYLIGNGTIRLDNSSEYQELERFRDARNKLAHLNIIDFETVDVILKRSESIWEKALRYAGLFLMEIRYFPK